MRILRYERVAMVDDGEDGLDMTVYDAPTTESVESAVAPPTVVCMRAARAMYKRHIAAGYVG